MEEHDVPTKFNFQGNIIWITNDNTDAITKALPQWRNALLSRFNMAKCYFTDEQKFMYTMHLIQNEDMLGKKCQEFKGGYPRAIINEALEYMSTNYRLLVEVTPRQAIKIADILHHNHDPKLRIAMLQQLWK
jgi:hypothetical protein